MSLSNVLNYDNNSLFLTEVGTLYSECSEEAGTEVRQGQKRLDDVQRLLVHLLGRLQSVSQ